MNSRRGSLEIAVEILKVALEGATKTQIMYGANLSYTSLRRYLKLLEGIGLLENKGRIYRTTDKGLRFLAIVKGAEEKGPPELGRSS